MAETRAESIWERISLIVAKRRDYTAILAAKRENAYEMSRTSSVRRCLRCQCGCMTALSTA